jgi:hypothetical protein
MSSVVVSGREWGGDAMQTLICSKAQVADKDYGRDMGSDKASRK